MSTRVFLPVALSLLLLAGCDRTDSAWEEARQADTIPAYEEFLSRHPDAAQSNDARERIRDLRKTERWQQATAADSAEAYRAFMDEYPDASESRQAETKIFAIEARQGWEALRESNDEAALRQFATQHQGTPEAEQASERAEDLAVAFREAQAREEERLRAAEAARTHRVQLAAFDSEQRAREGQGALTQRLSNVLGDVGLEVASSGRYQLVRTQPMEQADARALCERLKSAGQDCLVVQR